MKANSVLYNAEHYALKQQVLTNSQLRLVVFLQTTTLPLVSSLMIGEICAVSTVCYPLLLNVYDVTTNSRLVNKPAGVVIYSPKNAGQALLTIKSALPHVLQPPKAGTISALRRPKAVHRLDRPTSGALLIGKTLPAMDHLSRQFQNRVVKKTYTAVVNGIPKEEFSTTISSREAFELGVDVDPLREIKWQLIDSPLDDKTAVTIWRAVRYVPSIRANDNCLTLIEVKPKTGRYHQIRRHLVRFTWLKEEGAMSLC